jgi:hypothetical protein
MILVASYPDSTVTKDGVSYVVSLPSHPTWWALYWSDALSAGHIEFNNGDLNQSFTDTAVYEPFLDLWQAAYDAEHPELTPAEAYAAALADLAIMADTILGRDYTWTTAVPDGLPVRLDDAFLTRLHRQAVGLERAQLGYEPYEYSAPNWSFGAFVQGDGVPLYVRDTAGGYYSIDGHNLRDILDDAFRAERTINATAKGFYDDLVAALATVGSDAAKLAAIAAVVADFSNAANWPGTDIPYP